MKKHATLVGTAVLSALVGGTVVWSVMKTAPGPDAEERSESVAAAQQVSDSEAPAGSASTGSSVPPLIKAVQVTPSTADASDAAQAAAQEQNTKPEGETAQPSGSPAGAELPATMQRNDVPARISTAHATVIDQVVVPVPSEIFAVLDKMGKPQWKQVLRPMEGLAGARGGVEETALLLGYTIAEGFVAVEAEDVQKVKDIGRRVLILSDAIGVRKAVLKRSNAIVQAADRRQWATVRKEFDGALADVREAMRELNSQATADLVSLGGWIRGTDALASVVRSEYSEDAAGLLHQPGLIDHFSGRISSLPQRTRDLPIVNTLQKGLASIRPLMGAGAVSKEAVEQIGQMTGSLVQLIEGR